MLAALVVGLVVRKVFGLTTPGWTGAAAAGFAGVTVFAVARTVRVLVAAVRADR